MRDFIGLHLGKVIILAAILIVFLLTARATKINKMVEVRQESDPGYFDDGKGLVSVGGYDQLTTFRSFQSWRNSHPDRFRRVINIAVSSYWSGAVIAYNPDTTVVAGR